MLDVTIPPISIISNVMIGTLVYRMGITGGNFSYAAAVGLFEGLIGLILVSIANFLSKKLTETSLW